jgi:hypothetical protein
MVGCCGATIRTLKSAIKRYLRMVASLKYKNKFLKGLNSQNSQLSIKEGRGQLGDLLSAL